MKAVALGLKENWRQFGLLVLVNGFVGGMVGMERSILPSLAAQEFGIAARTAILSFIVAFGLVKAVSNYFAGAFAQRFGRKNLLIAGWIFAIPVPFMLMFAPGWGWVIAANVLLGANQGLAWSSTVVMKIDLVGEKQRGFAMGLNEFAGYLSVALAAFVTSWIASAYGLRPYPFYTGVVLVALGLFFSIVLVRDTRHHVALEAAAHPAPRLEHVFWDTTWKNRNLGAVTQAGFVNNLNDGMAWGIFPIMLAAKGLELEQIGIVTAVYPAVWGLAQLLTGKLSDKVCKKDLLVAGMLLQAFVLLGWPLAGSMAAFVGLSALLGLGTAMVYPTFLASIAENTHPQDRAKSVGVFRLWRDSGYAAGAVVTGVVADLLNLEAAVWIVGGLTLLSGLVVKYRMHCGEDSSPALWEWILGKKAQRHTCKGESTNYHCDAALAQ